MVLFPIIGLLLWIVCLAGVVLICGASWALGKTVWWFLDLPDKLDKQHSKAFRPRTAPPPSLRPQPHKAPVPGRPPPPPKAPPSPVQPGPYDSSDIWPKWTPAYRLYKDRELAIWQEQFDALNSRE
ncbi:hypothetical protein [Pseudarthrobacter sp. NamE5]|uniref:hypothetical protein n=1 Tax=Pseudarthrobacter sp. NamE5 TaxID=2576839 RepID=UPI00110A55CE|nr:hypothetical protein [Pseudarthrobacter sp. NamE5]TLM86027.1 hypothetical protein FDW84_07065 [Pseudarthrobacter sp. NamE5]